MMSQYSCKLEQLFKFAENGGIGKCVANQDIIAKTEVDLMFFTGEVITVLKHIRDDVYLGYCEGVVGIFSGKAVEFNGPLRNLNKSLKSMESESGNQVDSDQHSPEQSPKRASLLQLPDPPSLSSSNDTDSVSSDVENNSQSSSSLNQNNDSIFIPSPRKSSISSISSEYSISQLSLSSDSSNNSYESNSNSNQNQVEHEV